MIRVNKKSPFDCSNYGRNYIQKLIVVNSFIPKQTFNNFEEIILNIITKLNTSYFCCLIYGQIQSGKTLFFITLMIYLIQEYKNTTFIILCNNNEKLIEQTNTRIKNEFKKIGLKVNRYTFEEFKHTKNYHPNNINIFLCLKEKNHLEKLNLVLKNNNFKNLFLIDDECDIATISDGRITSEINSIVDKCKASFLVSATPFDNFNYNVLKKLTPTKIFCLKPDKKYFGLKQLHKIINSYQNDNILTINTTFKNTNSINSDLFDKINIYLELVKNEKNSFSTMLINNEKNILDQNILMKNITNYLKTLNLNNKIDVGIMNSSNESRQNDFKLITDSINYKKPQIIIGKNKISRGVTFKNLKLSYLSVNNANKNVDSLLQEARWFGYRNNINDLYIALTENVQDYYSIINDIVEYQFYRCTTDELDIKAINELVNNFNIPKKLKYAKNSHTNNSVKEIFAFDVCNLNFDINSQLTEIINKLSKNSNKQVIENNVCYFFNDIFELSNFFKIDEKSLAKTIKNITDFDYKKYKQKINNKKIVIRLISSKNGYKTNNYRKIIHKEMFSDNKSRFSIHNYNDEYNPLFKDYILFDIVEYTLWEYSTDY